MPPVAAKDTPVQRKLKIISAVTRRLDELPDDAVARVLTWMDGLVDGTSADSELKTMKSIAAQFDGVDPAVRESVVRWLNEEYLESKPDDVTDTAPTEWAAA